MSSNQIPFLELGYQNNFLFSQAKSINCQDDCQRYRQRLQCDKPERSREGRNRDEGKSILLKKHLILLSSIMCRLQKMRMQLVWRRRWQCWTVWRWSLGRSSAAGSSSRPVAFSTTLAASTWLSSFGFWLESFPWLEHSATQSLDAWSRTQVLNYLILPNEVVTLLTQARTMPTSWSHSGGSWRSCGCGWSASWWGPRPSPSWLSPSPSTPSSLSSQSVTHQIPLSGFWQPSVLVRLQVLFWWFHNIFHSLVVSFCYLT